MVYPTHALEYYAAIKNNEEDSYIPVWSDLQNTLSDKSKMQALCRVCYIVFFFFTFFYIVFFKGIMYIYIC